jgi:hypothetical protein
MADTHDELIDAGMIAHPTIDRLLPTDDEKDGLLQLAPTIPDFTSDGLRTEVSTDNTANPPTDAELDTAFGTPAAVGSGFLAILDDNGAGNNVYLIVSDGSNWWHVALTKAS